MRVRPVCSAQLGMLLTLIIMFDPTVAEASLTVSPNKQQFFEYESVTFHCGGVPHCEVVHEVKGKVSACEATNARTRTGASCTLKTLYAEDNGEYWFKTGGGGRSNSINIIVTGGPVILESPVLPVMEGEDVVLSCRNKTTTSQLTADFYKDGRHIGRSSTGNMTVYRVSKSDEGFYMCETTAGKSPKSWMSVRADADREAPPPSSVNTPWVVLTVLLLVVLLVVGLRHFGKHHWNRPERMWRFHLRPGSAPSQGQTGEGHDSHVSYQSPPADAATYATVTKHLKKKKTDEDSTGAIYYILGGDEEVVMSSSGPPPATTNQPVMEAPLYSTIQEVSHR